MSEENKVFKVTAEIEIPRVPNFLRMTDGQTLPISAISEEDLCSIANEWKESLCDRAIEMRAAKS